MDQRTVAQQIGVRGGDGAVLVVIREGDEAAERYGAQGIEHAVASPLQQGRPEADREAADTDALPAGCQEMAALVHHDQPRQDRQCRENSHASQAPQWLHCGPCEAMTGSGGASPAFLSLQVPLRSGCHRSARVCADSWDQASCRLAGKTKDGVGWRYGDWLPWVEVRLARNMPIWPETAHFRIKYRQLLALSCLLGKEAANLSDADLGIREDQIVDILKTDFFIRSRCQIHIAAGPGAGS